MSYCRWINGSDIYLYGDVHYNGICCMWCCLKDKTHSVGEEIDGNMIFKTHTDAIKHMKEHLRQGDRAPYKRVIEHLKEEMKEEGDIIDYSSFVEDAHASYKRDNYIDKPLKSQFRWI